MTQKDITTLIEGNPEAEQIAKEIAGILILYFMRSGWKFWANPFFWLSVGKAIWPLIEKLFITIFKNRKS
jgi:hypothetical protein